MWVEERKTREGENKKRRESFRVDASGMVNVFETVLTGTSSGYILAVSRATLA